MNELQEQEFRKKEICKTTERLKVLEKLEKFREEKMMKELEALEFERRKEEEEVQKARDRERKRQQYLDKQRYRLE